MKLVGGLQEKNMEYNTSNLSLLLWITVNNYTVVLDLKLRVLSLSLSVLL